MSSLRSDLKAMGNSGDSLEDMNGDEARNSPSCVVQPVMELSLEEHVRNVDTGFVRRGDAVPFGFFDDQCIDLSKRNCPSEVVVDPIGRTESAVFMIVPPPMGGREADDDYARRKYVGWRLVSDMSRADFASTVYNAYRASYQSFLPDLNIVPMSGIERLGADRRRRRNGRAVFHYVGCGGTRRIPLSIGDLMRCLEAPLLLVFDCNYAAAAIEGIEKQVEKRRKAGREAEKGRAVNWDDWFGIFATDRRESLPDDPRLPLDFLTTCLMTPVRLGILCHMLKFYTGAGGHPQFPLEDPAGFVVESMDLENLLDRIVEAIAADYLTPEMFTRLLRRDKVVAVYFKRFIFAQRLLEPYGVHPVSHPMLPTMTRHPLWHEWETAVDDWISAEYAATPALNMTYNQRVIDVFHGVTDSKRMDETCKPSVLVALAQIPLVDKSMGHVVLEAMISLMKGTQTKQLAAAISISSYIQILTENDRDAVTYELVLILLLWLFHLDIRNVMYVGEESVVMKVYDMIFDESISEHRRVLTTALIASIAPHTQGIQDRVTDKTFFNKFKMMIPKVSSQFLLWLLILFKRVHRMSTCNRSFFYEDSVHMQVAQVLVHKSHECRAAAISCLACFMQGSASEESIMAMLMSLCAMTDISCLVRYQALLLIVRFITSFDNAAILAARKQSAQGIPATFSELIGKWFAVRHEPDMAYIDTEFNEYMALCDRIKRQKDAAGFVFKMALYALDVYIADPHPDIHQLASSTKSDVRDSDSKTQSKTTGSVASGAQSLSTMNSYPLNGCACKVPSNSVGRPVPNVLISTGDTSETSDPAFSTPVNTHSDSDGLYAIALRRLVYNRGSWLEAARKVPHEIAVSRDFSIESVEFKPARAMATPFPKRPVKLALHMLDQSMAIATTGGRLHHLNQMQETGHIDLRHEISDVKVVEWSGTAYVLACTDQGCTSIWQPGSKSVCATWRSAADYVLSDSPQLMAAANDYLAVATVRSNCGVTLWDVERQKLVGEWKGGSLEFASALTFDPRNVNIVIAGYKNGKIVTIDTRVKNKEACTMTFDVQDDVIAIEPNRSGGDFLYAATSSGACISWRPGDRKYRPAFHADRPMRQFSVHQSDPVVVYSTQEKTSAMCRTLGSVLHESKSDRPLSVFAFHPILPVITYCYEDGSVEWVEFFLGR